MFLTRQLVWYQRFVTFAHSCLPTIQAMLDPRRMLHSQTTTAHATTSPMDHCNSNSVHAVSKLKHTPLSPDNAMLPAPLNKIVDVTRHSMLKLVRATISATAQR
jgi:hypothetical protein